MKVTHSPDNIPKSNSRPISRVMSSDQMAAILHEHSSPVARITPRQLRSNRAGGGISVSTARRPLAGTKRIGNVSNNNSANFSLVARKPLAAIELDENLHANNSTESVSSNKAFCKKFSSWLKDTEQECDSERFDRLKEDLWKLVGEYALDKQEE